MKARLLPLAQVCVQYFRSQNVLATRNSEQRLLPQVETTPTSSLILPSNRLKKRPGGRTLSNMMKLLRNLTLKSGCTNISLNLIRKKPKN
jgi:hypothetical protein